MAPRERIVACKVCGQVQQVEILPAGAALECCRCHAIIEQRKRQGVGVTAALALSALFLYVPANIYPILTMQQYGVYSESTVGEGVVPLAQTRQWFVALIVL